MTDLNVLGEPDHRERGERWPLLEGVDPVLTTWGRRPRDLALSRGHVLLGLLLALLPLLPPAPRTMARWGVGKWQGVGGLGEVVRCTRTFDKSLWSCV